MKKLKRLIILVFGIITVSFIFAILSKIAILIIGANVNVSVGFAILMFIILLIAFGIMSADSYYSAGIIYEYIEESIGRRENVDY